MIIPYDANAVADGMILSDDRGQRAPICVVTQPIGSFGYFFRSML